MIFETIGLVRGRGRTMGAGSGSDDGSVSDPSTRDLLTRIIDNSGNFANMVIDNVSNDRFTFSYDAPPLYNNESIYRNIVNTLMGQSSNATNQEGVANDDIVDMNVDDNELE